MLAAARDAVGGNAAVNQIRSLLLLGKVRSGFNGVTGQPSKNENPLELRVLLPSRYLRIETNRFERRLSGFDGTLILSKREAAADAVLRQPASAPPRELQRQRELLSRLMVGFFALTDVPIPLRAQAAAPADGKQESVRLSGPDGFELVLDVDAVTHIPTAVRYRSRERFPRPLTEAERSAGVVPPPQPLEEVEASLLFEDRRTVDGLKVPFRIKRVAKGVSFEDIVIEQLTVNGALSPDDFVVK